MALPPLQVGAVHYIIIALVLAETMKGVPGAFGTDAALILTEAADKTPSLIAFTAATLNQ